MSLGFRGSIDVQPTVAHLCSVGEVSFGKVEVLPHLLLTKPMWSRSHSTAVRPEVGGYLTRCTVRTLLPKPVRPLSPTWVLQREQMHQLSSCSSSGLQCPPASQARTPPRCPHHLDRCCRHSLLEGLRAGPPPARLAVDSSAKLLLICLRK